MNNLTTKEKEEIIKNYQKELDQFIRKTRECNDEKLRDAIIAFVTGEIDEIPVLDKDEDYEEYQTLSEVLKPCSEWTFVDHRIIQFLTSKGWHYLDDDDDSEGFYNNFYGGYLRKMLALDENSFNTILPELKKNGITDDMIVKHLIEMTNKFLFDKNGKANSAGLYLVDMYDQYSNIMLEGPAHERYPLFGLFAEYKSESFDKKLDKLLYNDNQYAPCEELTYLFRVDAKKYENYAVKALEMKKSQVSLMKTVKLLIESFGEKYYDIALENAKQTINFIQDKKEKGQFSFYWKGFVDSTDDFIEWCLVFFKEDILQEVTNFAKYRRIIDIDSIVKFASAIGEKSVGIATEIFKIEDSSDLEKCINSTSNSNCYVQKSIEEKSCEIRLRGDVLPHFERVFDMLSKYDSKPYHKFIWPLLNFKSFKLNVLAAEFLANCGNEILEEAILKVSSEDQKDKRAALLVLSFFKQDKKALEILKNHKQNIKEYNLHQLILDTLGFSLEDALEEVEALNKAKKLKKSSKKWLDTLPSLLWKNDNSEIDPTVIRYIFKKQLESKEIAPVAQIKPILENIDPGNNTFAKELYKLIIKNGGIAAKTRFTLALLGTIANEDIIEQLVDLASKKKNINIIHTLEYSSLNATIIGLNKIQNSFNPNSVMCNEVRKILNRIANKRNISVLELLKVSIPGFGARKSIEDASFKKIESFFGRPMPESYKEFIESGSYELYNNTTCTEHFGKKVLRFSNFKDIVKLLEGGPWDSPTYLRENGSEKGKTIYFPIVPLSIDYYEEPEVHFLAVAYLNPDLPVVEIRCSHDSNDIYPIEESFDGFLTKLENESEK